MLKQATLHFSRAPNLPFVDPQMSSQAVRQEMMALGTQVARLKGILRAEWKRRSACGGGGDSRRWAVLAAALEAYLQQEVQCRNLLATLESICSALPKCTLACVVAKTTVAAILKGTGSR